MTTNTSSIADATSEVKERVKTAIQATESKMSAARLLKLRQVKEHAEGLSKRGLLREPKYSPSGSAADFEKQYLSKRG